MTSQPLGGPLPPDRLDAILNQAVLQQTALGWRLEARYGLQAVMRSRGQVNHILHLLLTVFLCGFWLPVWIILAITGGEKRLTIAVDPHGVVLFNGRPAAPIPPPRSARHMAPQVPTGLVNAQAVAAVSQRRELRNRARQQAAADQVLARELRVGRPDLPRQFDDGGLIDVNHVPAPVLTCFAGVTPEMAEHIVAIRGQVGRFTSAEDLAAAAGLHPDLVPEILEYGIFLP